MHPHSQAGTHAHTLKTLTLAHANIHPRARAPTHTLAHTHWHALARACTLPTVPCNNAPQASGGKSSRLLSDSERTMQKRAKAATLKLTPSLFELIQAKITM